MSGVGREQTEGSNLPDGVIGKAFSSLLLLVSSWEQRELLLMAGKDSTIGELGVLADLPWFRLSLEDDLLVSNEGSWKETIRLNPIRRAEFFGWRAVWRFY